VNEFLINLSCEITGLPGVPEVTPAEPVFETIRLEASQVIPEGTFINQKESPILGA